MAQCVIFISKKEKKHIDYSRKENRGGGICGMSVVYLYGISVVYQCGIPAAYLWYTIIVGVALHGGVDYI